MASVALEPSKKRDEIKKFVNSRFIMASESMWRFFKFDVHSRDPSVQCLAVHEEDKQTVVFKEYLPLKGLQKKRKTTLLAWFDINREDNASRSLKYHEIPKNYVWDEKKQKWCQQKRDKAIGRVCTTNPAQGERCYLCMLLHHIPSAMSYGDLRALPDGAQCDTFKETAI